MHIPTSIYSQYLRKFTCTVFILFACGIKHCVCVCLCPDCFLLEFIGFRKHIAPFCTLCVTEYLCARLFLLKFIPMHICI